MAKHPVPKKKTSRARGNRREKAFTNKARVRLGNSVQLVKCENCGQMMRAHHICPHCGFYNGKDVMNNATKEAAKIVSVKAD